MECNAFRDEMLDVLYEEADAATRRRFAEHQKACASCREELAALLRVRDDLGAWRLPADLQPPRVTRLFRSAWAPRLAAAAVVLVLGAGLVLAGAELRWEEGRMAVRLGPPGASPARADLEQRLAAQQTRHRQEVEALRAELRQAQERSEAALLARLSDLFRQSEARQAALVGTSVDRLRDETAAQRRYDLAQVGAGFSYLEGKTGLQAARTTELMGHVLQAAQKR